MVDKFRCATCGISFSSWADMKKHFLSKEHKDKAKRGNVESLMEKFLNHFKEAGNESSKV